MSQGSSLDQSETSVEQARNEYQRVILWLRRWGYKLQDSDGRLLRDAEETRLGDFYAGQSR